MSQVAWLIATVALVPVFIVTGLIHWRHARRAMVRRARIQARRDFRVQREQLEAKFLTLASASGKPRGLEWADCDFDNKVTYARDKQSGELCAFVAVNISFVAVEGGDMEDNPNVGNLRAATAVFSYRNGHWETDGRAIMNLQPEQAINHFRNEVEPVE